MVVGNKKAPAILRPGLSWFGWLAQGGMDHPGI